MRAALHEIIRLTICPRLVDELRRVLRRDRFRRYLSVDEAGIFVESIEAVSDLVPDPQEVPRVSRDPADDYLIALARRENVNGIISGDSDLKVEGGPPALSPRTVLDHLLLGPAHRTLVIAALWNLHLRIEQATSGSDDPELTAFVGDLRAAVRVLGGDPDAAHFRMEDLGDQHVDVRDLTRSQRSACAYALELDRRAAGQLHAEHLDDAERLPLAFEILDRYAAVERLFE